MTTRVMALSDQAEICGCNGVCKGDIIQAISNKGLFTLEEVRTPYQSFLFLRLLHWSC